MKIENPFKNLKIKLIDVQNKIEKLICIHCGKKLSCNTDSYFNHEFNKC